MSQVLSHIFSGFMLTFSEFNFQKQQAAALTENLFKKCVLTVVL